MGISIPALDASVRLYEQYGPLGKMLQLGRQQLYVPEWDLDQADVLVRRAGVAESFRALVGSDSFADEHLFPALGADPAMSADADPYEGAQIVHNFNDPIAPELHQSFDTIMDGGTLEHVFNLPTALSNVMNMLKIGGRFVSITPANNWLGHGFYQFGPELFFRVFTAENGFAISSVDLFGVHGPNSVMRLSDTGAEGIRNEIGLTEGQVDLVFIAVKREHVPLFRTWPTQGDYRATWEYVAAQTAQ